MILLREASVGEFEGFCGNVEVLVRQLKGKWTYTILERSAKGGFGCYGSSPKLEEVLRKISQHLYGNIRVWILLKDA